MLPGRVSDANAAQEKRYSFSGMKKSDRLDVILCLIKEHNAECPQRTKLGIKWRPGVAGSSRFLEVVAHIIGTTCGIVRRFRKLSASHVLG